MPNILSYIDRIIKPEVEAEIPEPKTHSKVNFEQEKERAGLLCTEELKIATDRCKRKVEAIIKDCRARNCRFRDIEFDLEGDQDRCLYGLVPDKDSLPSPADVLRVTQIFEEPQFFIDGASSSDIAQGSLGDCWFLSAVSTVTTMEGLINRICVHRDEEVGVYGFVFYRDSGWIDVVIDDLLYTRIPKYEELWEDQKDLYHGDRERFEARARIGGKTLYFSRSKTENETCPLLEKAYAKLNGDYQAIVGGFDAEAIEALTGGISTLTPIKDILDVNKFWQELLNVEKDRLFGCAIDGSRADEITGKRFVRIRNPWGKSEWKGPWSDGSKEWTGQWLTLLPELHHKFGDDGEFLMEYKDFLKTWTTVERSRVFDAGWKLSSMWLNVTSRSYPCAWMIPSLHNSHVLGDKRLAGLYYTLPAQYKLIEPTLGAPSEEHYARSYHNWFWQRVASVELDNLEAGDYVLHVRLDRKHIRKKTYYQDSVEEWDSRKLSKVWTQAAISKSIAIKELFGGEDLTSLEEKQIAVEVPQPTTASESNPALSTNEASVVEAGKLEPSGTTSEGKSSEREVKHTDEKKPEPAEKSEDQPAGTASESTNAVTHPAANGENEKKDAKEEKNEKPVIVTTVELAKVVHEGFMCKVCKKCMKSKPNLHDKTHKLLHIQTEEDSKKLKDQPQRAEGSHVILGRGPKSRSRESTGHHPAPRSRNGVPNVRTQSDLAFFIAHPLRSGRSQSWAIRSTPLLYRVQSLHGIHSDQIIG
ncbi:calpain [Rhizoctonia solani AG-1 IA]|uniref:Calpain n=1 Tax=Thanatephorus cucumeris (strain AG1-IA) TaxID=983506 RepID=L8WTW8_THACA|nr:calpain [Rhizoctonia solani AG-1 IA]